MKLPSFRTRTWVLIAIGTTAVVLFVALVGWQGARAWMAWNSIERVEFDPETARAQLSQLETPPSTVSTPSTTVPAPEDQVEYLSVLVIGSDARNDNPDRYYEFADAVMLYLVPDDGSGPVAISFPRDTVVADPCTGSETSLTWTLTPCETYISAPEHVALTVEDLTDIPINHFVTIDFEVFAKAVDLVGGVEICTEYAMRESGYVIKEAGCTTLDGEHALAFIRSRATQVLIDGQWTFVEEEIGDVGRVSRHRLLLLAMLDELAAMRDPAELAGFAEELGDGVVLSDTLGLGDAVALAWDVRSESSIRTFVLPTEGSTLHDGETYAARPTITVKELLEGSQ